MTTIKVSIPLDRFDAILADFEKYRPMLVSGQTIRVEINNEVVIEAIKE